MRTKHCLNELLLVAIFGICSWGCQVTSNSQGSGGTTGTGGAAGNSGAGGAKTFDPTKPPCDTYKEDGSECVAAHSTVRRLLSSYSGPLYQLRVGGSKSGTGGSLAEVGIGADGYADGASQVSTCGDEDCFIAKIYDQSGRGNHLTVAPAGGAKKTPDNEANAKAFPLTLNGHDVFGVHVTPGVGYRNNQASGTTKGDDAQTVYMVVHAKYFNSGCCFDYGNAETNSNDNGEGTMEAVYFGNCTIWNKGDGDGPWIMGDLENGLWAGDFSPYPGNKSIPGDYKYVTGMVKGDKAGKNHWSIKIGNAQSGDLTLAFDGKRPSDRYNPMRLEGAIILGTGGDNSSADQGNWFEGVMTTHYSSDAADQAVQANIVAAYKE
jgi:non-reducing end alpha-L-arabinofuranosidase